MKKLVVLLCLFSLSGLVFAAAEAPSAPSKPMSIVNEDEDQALDLSASNHDALSNNEDESIFSPPPAEDAEGGTRLSMNQSALKDDDYN